MSGATVLVQPSTWICGGNSVYQSPTAALCSYWCLPTSADARAAFLNTDSVQHLPPRTVVKLHASSWGGLELEKWMKKGLGSLKEATLHQNQQVVI